MGEATEAQQRAAETKRLVFQNLLNGVPPEVLAPQFKLSIDDIRKEFADVLFKIKCYMRKRNIVGFDKLNGLADARRERIVVLHVLERLGPVYLTASPEYKRIETHPFDDAFVRRNLTGQF